MSETSSRIPGIGRDREIYCSRLAGKLLTHAYSIAFIAAAFVAVFVAVFVLSSAVALAQGLLPQTSGPEFSNAGPDADVYGAKLGYPIGLPPGSRVHVAVPFRRAVDVAVSRI
jgi:hypothetical protein